LDAEPGVGAESSFEQGFTGSHLRAAFVLESAEPIGA
jgi:hypothetical protein